jgi:hypothetical protein
LVDAWLGLDTERVERLLVKSSEHQLWVGLGAEKLLTPYTELRLLLSQLELKDGDTIIDLGAAYGRMGFVLGRHYPEVYFVGYELAKERVEHGNECLKRHGCLRAELRHVDLSDRHFELSSATYFFIYDYGSRAAIEKTLQDLLRIAVKQRQTVRVIGRGRASRDAIERGHPWLSQVVAPRHYKHYSIYSSS